jgi:hypothetical protein
MLDLSAPVTTSVSCARPAGIALKREPHRAGLAPSELSGPPLALLLLNNALRAHKERPPPIQNQDLQMIARAVVPKGSCFLFLAANRFVQLEPGLKMASIIPKVALLARQAPSTTRKGKQARINARHATLDFIRMQVLARV